MDSANLPEFEQQALSANRYQRLVYSRALILGRNQTGQVAPERGANLSDATEVAPLKSASDHFENHPKAGTTHGQAAD
jgi:hypothetical protein